jgi:hypothetical protein
MALAEDTNRRGRERLPVVAILVLVALMALVGGVLAASSGARSQSPCARASCVFVLDEGLFGTVGFLFPADPEDSLVGLNNRGLIVGGHIDAEGSHGYFRERRERFATIDVPGAAGTLSYDLNGRRQVVDIYSNAKPRPAAADDTRGFPRDERG